MFGRKVADIPAEEQVVWDALTYAWNKFMRGIHMCQYVLGMRLNRKNYPDVFYKAH